MDFNDDQVLFLVLALLLFETPPTGPLSLLRALAARVSHGEAPRAPRA